MSKALEEYPLTMITHISF